jgi:putative transposase
MITLLSAIGSLLSFRVRSRASLELELVALRHQVTVLRRQRSSRPRLFAADRLLWVWLYRLWPQVVDAMVLVKPATVVQWHRQGFRLYWRRRSRHLGRPGVSREIRDLIREMSLANPLWRAPRIHGELLKLASTSAGPRSADTCHGNPRSPPQPGAHSCTITCMTPSPSTCLSS